MNDFSIENSILLEYTGSGGDVVIPDGVRTIGPFAFSDYDFSDDDPSDDDDVWAEGRERNITSVTIPNSVRRIENYAFSGRTETERIFVPASVIFFGEDAFEYCPNLTLIVVPGSTAEGYARWHAIPYRLAE